MRIFVPHQSRAETRARAHRPGKFRSSRETGAPRRSARARGAGTRASTRTAAMEARRAEAELERRRADALLTACDLGLTDDVAALIAGGATFEAMDKAGVRPMTFAAARGTRTWWSSCVRTGSTRTTTTRSGAHLCTSRRCTARARVVRALASRPGTWVDPPDHLDDTPLTLAARMADAETIAALLDAGATRARETKRDSRRWARRSWCGAGSTSRTCCWNTRLADRPTRFGRTARETTRRVWKPKKAFVEVLETTTAGPAGGRSSSPPPRSAPRTRSRGSGTRAWTSTPCWPRENRDEAFRERFGCFETSAERDERTGRRLRLSPSPASRRSPPTRGRERRAGGRRRRSRDGPRRDPGFHERRCPRWK